MATGKSGTGRWKFVLAGIVVYFVVSYYLQGPGAPAVVNSLPPPPPPPVTTLSPVTPRIIPSDPARLPPAQPAAEDQRPEETSSPADSQAEPQPTLAASSAPAPQKVTSASIGPLIVSLCLDSHGNLWVGTEEEGLFRKDPQGVWTKYSSAHGLGDNFVYALCEDRLGRIWAGHVRSGVSVFNGETWKNYDVLKGPLGARIYDIVCSPLNGEIWMATCLGLACYSEEQQTWSYRTQADGLPSDQINSLAFTKSGDFIIGTQCDGLAIGSAQDDYHSWKLISGDLSNTKYRDPFGKGLPSSQINDILVHSDGTVYVATNLGLAKSEDHGETWTYLRGRDYDEKVNGRMDPPPKSWKPLKAEDQQQLLPEDYICVLAEDLDQRLWLGHRQRGVICIDLKSKSVAANADPFPNNGGGDMVLALAATSEKTMWLGGFGHGLLEVDSSLQPVEASSAEKHETDSIPSPATASPAINPEFPPHPLPAAPPTVAELVTWRERLNQLRTPLPETWATYLHDDWMTMGDWVGRIGRRYAVLCAAGAPLDHYLVNDADYKIRATVGKHGVDHEQIRRWVHWLRTDQHRVLYDPAIGHRREAEWDDHAEYYPMSHEGPDVWVSVQVPAGINRVSFYFVNKDGHDGHNRFRDYLLEVKPWKNDNTTRADKLPTLAKARVQQFWGGCYKMFALKGPNKYWVKVNCNDSFNTIVCGVFTDELTGRYWFYEPMQSMYMGEIHYKAPTPVPLPPGASPQTLAALELQQAATPVSNINQGMSHHRIAQLLAFRVLNSEENIPEAMLKRARWQLRYWTPEDRTEFTEKTLAGWNSHLKLNPRTAELVKQREQDESRAK